MGRVPGPGRRPAPVPDPDSPLGRFAQELRDLRGRAGGPSFRTLAQETGRLGSPYSETSLRNAASGRVQPSWDVTEMFVRACAAFARGHPRQAGEESRGWDAEALVDAWAARWRGLSAAGTGPAGGTAGLPAALTRFVGRERELAEGAALVRANRLVTVTGVGGVGKTRLALRLAGTLAGCFPDGVRLVELAGVTEPAMVDRTVAAALGVQMEAGRAPLDALAEALGGRRTLLVLDNCEHLLEAVVALVGALLRAVPELHVLATGRQPLNVAGERVVMLGPLPPESAAVELFADRAVAAVPGFRVTAGNRDAIVGVCRRLEGLPLALELAAPRLRLLTVDELADRLDRRFVLLGEAGADRTAHPRHQTLRAVFDWSHELCGEEERLAWERLSVCAGSVSLADAEALCAGAGARDAFDAIAGLVDKSLLTRVEVRGRTRLLMLETVRMYGRERLALSGAEADARCRHLDRYLGLARSAEAEYGTPRQLEWLLRLQEEHADIRQAFAHLLSGEEYSVGALEGAFGLWLYWVACGNVGEGAHWMRRMTAPGREPADPALAVPWAYVLWTAAFVLLLNGDRDGTGRLLDRCEAALERAANAGNDASAETGIRAAVHQLRGLSALFAGDTERTERHSRAALRAGEPRPGLLTEQQCLAQLGLAASIRGDHAESVDLIRRALAIAERDGEVWHRSYLLWVLAIEYAETGRGDDVTALLRGSLELKRRFGDGLGMATVSETLAWVLARRGDPRPAARLLGAAHGAWRPAGAPRLWGFAHLVDYRDRSVGRVRAMLGDGPYEREYRDGERLGLAGVLDEVIGDPRPA
ncbi:AAA family ATPase [Spirillospora sp. NPDC029432]|uniref:ATP-binding protein n=1 Tax=Spirillospora sp. NPDC029432 TaxID=3154599 RepID=UPI003455CE54